MSGRGTRAGMTLIELLVALTIGSVIIAAVLGVLTSGQRARDQGEARSDLFQTLRVTLGQVDRDLRVAVTRENDESFLFVGTDDELNGLPNDSLEFSAASGAPATALLPTSDLVRVRYFLDNDPETPYHGLMREALSLPLPAEISPEVEELSTRPYCPPAVGINATYYDATAQEWVEEWQDRTDLPAAVRVDLYVLPEMPKDEAELEEITPGDVTVYTTTIRLALASAPLGTGQASSTTATGTGEATGAGSGMPTMPGVSGPGGTGGLPGLPGMGGGGGTP